MSSTRSVLRAVVRAVKPGVLSLIALLFAACAAQPTVQSAGSPSAKRPGEYAFVDVAVIPMQTERVLEHQTVLVKAGRIAAIGPAKSLRVDAGVTVIDGKGRYLLPGLADMHVHLWDERELPLYLANGITVVRNMWGESSTLAMRERIAKGELLGPTILTAGPLIDGEPRIWAGSARAVTAAEGEQLVSKHKAAGYDFIKIYSNLQPDVFDAIATAAKRESIVFAGHTPESVPLQHALHSGMASIEHMTGYMRATLVDGIDMGVNPRSPVMLALGKRVAAGAVPLNQVVDDKKVQAIAAETRDAKVWNTPTLLVLKNGLLTRAEVKASMARSTLQYVPPAMQMGWNRVTRKEEDQLALQALNVASMQRVAALQRAGAGLLAGTDAPNPHVIHGFALQQELALLQQAGLTPYQVLRTATVNPAEYFHAGQEFGSIAAGMRADLLLVDANPLADLTNLQRRSGVMLRGQWLPEAQLQTILQRVADSYKQAPDWFAGLEPLPVAANADVRLRAQFQSSYDGKPLAAERLAVLAAPQGGRSVIVQSQNSGRNAVTQNYRLELDATASLLRYTFAARGQFGGQGSLERNGNQYRFTLPGSKEQEQAITVGAGETVLTGTLADGFILTDRLRHVPADTATTLAMWKIVSPRGGPTLERQTWTVRRRPKAADGANGFDIDVQREGVPEALTWWFADKDGTPLRLEQSEGLFQQRRID